MQVTPFFSIITAALNSERTIGKSLTSVNAQNFKNVEHIIVDGNSKDNTVNIIKKFERSFNLIWLSENDNGIAEALNKGLKLAKGNYIYVLGADDYLIDDNILSHVYEAIKDERYDIYSLSVIVDHPARGNLECRPFRFKWWHRFRNVFPHQGVFVHRRLFERVGNFSEKYSISMDYDFFYRALISGCSVKLINMPAAIMGGSGLSSNKEYLVQRLREEIEIQKLNEPNIFWKLAQSIFWIFYFPHKTRRFTFKEILTYQK